MNRRNRNEPMLEPWQASYLRRATKLRRAMSVKALSVRMGLSPTTVVRYGNGHRGADLG